MATPRQAWRSRLGVVLAVAGSAIGLGNFLRFPVQCASNGGGAFLIPYFIALIFLGLPLMWAEWAMGRYGGQFGHGTTPGIFQKLWNHPSAKYFGSLGIVICSGLAIYYVYVESWTLAYAWFSLTGRYFGITTQAEMKNFLSAFQGIGASHGFTGIGTAYTFFLITFAINIYIMFHGIRGGIEKICNIGLPILFVFALILVVRVFTIGTPDPSHPENSVLNGLGFLWNPDFSQLTKAKVWLAAAGQIFFTLSVGFCTIPAYASYLKRNQDVALTGLSSVTANEFAEVILGGSIAIPIAVAFFGLSATALIAQGGAFNLGFAAMPLIFQKIPLGQLFGGIWFLLLFLAGITSSVSLCQPVITFLEDEFQWSRKKAVFWAGLVWFLSAHPVIYFLGNGYLDEMDFWVGTLGVVFFALIETILFIWVYGPEKAWQEINIGAEIRIPRFFLFSLKYITPLYLLFLLITWGKQDGIRILFMKGVPAENIPYIIAARLFMLALFLLITLLVNLSFCRRPASSERRLQTEGRR